MNTTLKWLIGLAAGMILTFLLELTLGGFSLYIHNAIGDVREQQQANTTLLQSFETRLEDMKASQRELRENDLWHMENRLESMDNRLGAIEEDIKVLLSRGKGR